MITILSALASLLSFRVPRRASLELELVALRHQVSVLRRQRKGRLQLFSADRLLWVWLYRIWPRVLNAMVLVKPATVIQWNRKGFRLYWRGQSGLRYLGRPKTSTEIRDLIRQMSMANPLWGAPRIHGELLKLGIEVSQATVGRYMPWRPKVPSPTWRTFLRNRMCDMVAVDMFVVATATFQLLYALIVLGHDRRRVIEVTPNPTQIWLARQMTEAFPWDTAPRYLMRDRDASYGQAFRDRVRAMGIKEVVTAARSPWQNAYVERIIGSIRRECLNHVIIFDERHLRGVLSSYFHYYHKTRTHLSLDKDCPDTRPIDRPAAGKIISFPEVVGLHHRYERRAA
jgi:transposase InsO family protein